MHTLVIGGTRGIGRVVADLLVSEGRRVTVVGRRPPETPLAEGAEFFPMDLTDLAALDERLKLLLERHGGLCSLICLQRFKAAQGDSWEGEIATSLTATRRLIEVSTPYFPAAGGGSIVLVSSAASRVIATEQGPGYHVAKAGLDQMARYYAVVLGPRGIRVNVVSPGTVLKPENEKNYLADAALQSLFKEVIPMGRMGTALEVARAVSFMCGADASFITGQTLLVDGGVNLLSCETLARSLARTFSAT